MSQFTPGVRILVVLPAASPAGGPPRDPHGTARAVARLGAEAQVESVHSLAEAQERAPDVDLIVIDLPEVAAGGRLLATLREEGPPAIAVVESGREADALEWFRHGAADCVAVGAEFQHLLRAVALEHIQRWRAIRKRHASERRIHWLERLNDAIVSQIPAGLAVLHPDHRIVMVNPAFSRTWGVAADAARGRALADLLPADLMETGGLEEVLAQASEGRDDAARIARTADAQGAPCAFDLRAARLNDDGHLLLVLSDVTERETLVRRVEALQRYNENIIQNMNSALLVVDTTGTITFANATAEAILGEEPGRLRGRSAWEWFSTAQSERDLLAQTLADGSSYRGAETIITRADGTVVPIGISCAPLAGADGAHLGAVAIFQDLTEIKQLQRQVLQTEKMASIGQLAAGVAHEINNPMGFIHANLFQVAEYLKDLRRLWEGVAELRKAASAGEPRELARVAAAFETLSEELDAEYLFADFAKAIRESQEGSERIRHIVRDLRDFSRHDTAERVASDLNLALDSTANIVWSMMKHSAVLRKQYAELPPVRCYPMQLKQVFMNLLVNAYQAIEERVGESGETGEIELRTELRGDRVVIAVSDTGIGILPENLDRIFEPFFTTKEVGEGTGLGLSTSYNIVRKHGGTIHAFRRAGGGATFEVILPLDGGGGPSGESGS